MTARTVAVGMVRDEADIIGTTVAHMLTQADAVLVADNASTDDTRAILADLQARHGADRLQLVDDPEPAYLQSAKITDLAQRARLQLGAEWIVPFDADEVWYSPFGRIADVLAELRPQWLVMPARLYDHVATALDDHQLDPVHRLAWRRTDPAPLPKVACRWRLDLTIAQGNHSASYAGGATVHDAQLVVRHFPYRSPAQLVRKVRNGAAAYRAAGNKLPPSMGSHWRQWGDLLDQQGEQAIVALFHRWYWRERPTAEVVIEGETQPPLIYDPAPVLSP